MSRILHITDQDGLRTLHLGGDAIQSAQRLDDPDALELEYTRAMMGFLLFRPQPRDVCLVGLGGGSMARFLLRYRTDCRLTAVELHPEVVEAARRHFGLPDDPHLSVVVGDGAAHVAKAPPGSQDVVLVDGYGPEGIAPELASAAFYRACRDLLRPGGVAVFNLWGSDRTYADYTQRADRAFAGHTLQLPCATKANVALLAFRPPLPDTSFATLATRAEQLQADMGMDFEDFLVRMGYCNPCSETAFLLETDST
jgi:spermidine synthase